MAKYLVELNHDEHTCRPSVDDMLERGPEFLSHFDWGCDAGVHTAWGTFEASSEDEVRAQLPGSLQQRARIIKVSKK